MTEWCRATHLFARWHVAVILVKQQEPEQGGVGGEGPRGPGVGPAAALVPARLCHFLLQTRETVLYSFHPFGWAPFRETDQWMRFHFDWYLQSVVEAKALARGAALSRPLLAALGSPQHSGVLKRQRWPRSVIIVWLQSTTSSLPSYLNQAPPLLLLLQRRLARGRRLLHGCSATPGRHNSLSIHSAMDCPVQDLCCILSAAAAVTAAVCIRGRRKIIIRRSGWERRQLLGSWWVTRFLCFSPQWTMFVRFFARIIKSCQARSYNGSNSAGRNPKQRPVFWIFILRLTHAVFVPNKSWVENHMRMLFFFKKRKGERTTRRGSDYRAATCQDNIHCGLLGDVDPTHGCALSAGGRLWGRLKQKRNAATEMTEIMNTVVIFCT